MSNVLRDHKDYEDIYIGYDNEDLSYSFDLLNLRNKIPFDITNPNVYSTELDNILNGMDFKYSSKNISIVLDISYCLGISKKFLNLVESYISNIKYPYTFTDIKIIKTYKKLVEKYQIKENNIIYKLILKDNNYCPCVTAIKNAIIPNYDNHCTKYLIDLLDFVNNNDKFLILDLLITKEIDTSIFKTETIYKKNFLEYLAYFLSLNDTHFSYLKYCQIDLLNHNVYLDNILTKNNEDNRKKIDLSKIFKKFSDQVLDLNILSLLHNVSRSIFMLRSEIIRYPIIEILLSILKNEKINFFLDIKNDVIRKKIDKSYKKIILDIFTNLLLEFGNYRSVFISLNGFYLINKLNHQYPFEILRLYKNFLYDNTIEIKLEFLRNRDEWFANIFNKNDDYDSEMMEVLFNLIRNLLCDKIMISSFLIEKIFIHLENTNNEKILLHILYCIGNLSANNVPFRDKLLYYEKSIKKIKYLFIIQKFHLALVWIIINLTWKDKGYKKRIEIIKKLEIKNDLIKIRTTNTFLMDKINTALENIEDREIFTKDKKSLDNFMLKE